MKILVTGAAGFIGSHLCEKLLQEETNEVIGLDGFIDGATPAWIRRRNIEGLLLHPRFQFKEADLLQVSWEELLPGVDIVYHLAGMPGVRTSWGPDFAFYVQHNIQATQRLLEGCKIYPIKRFIYASTSSVYGEKTGKVSEDAEPEPLSPYGVSKLTGEQLCRVYHRNDGLPIVILRFFTVYGPRQRTDMAFHRFIVQMQQGKPITLNGDGTQTRDFTYVQDCVEAVAAASRAEHVIGETINIGGKQRASVLECIAILEECFRQKAEMVLAQSTYGEPKNTWADISKAGRLLGYSPRVDLRTGLEQEMLYILQLYKGMKP
ncbi:NAD-dependent epimerase/dehydratase family protein [Paenibacillus sp. TAB 01]|uniref:NAD-dependent epimerase/dehydratase family protein n=1 Tax=Paenibacillus sp. TAB 01 TaxID=3368988 RepID=UPI003750AF86